MKKIIGSVAIFIATFLLLSINLKEKPVFSYIYSYFGPLTKELQNKVEYLVKFGLDGSKAFGSKIFHNSIPQHKENLEFNKTIKPLENVSAKDQKELDDLIKQ
ncbi:MAG: hypothetical protein LW878_04630 [Proteobacteria bacterium]|nr:hypothetical protein [Pseudomonadota bacterium]